MVLDECSSGGVFPPETVTLWWADQAERLAPVSCTPRIDCMRVVQSRCDICSLQQVSIDSAGDALGPSGEGSENVGATSR